MSAEVSLAAEFLGFVVALSLAGVGIWKLDLRLFAGGAAAGGLLWLAIACTSPVEWSSHEMVTLYLRPVDGETGESIAGVVAEQIETLKDGSEQTYRLPTRNLPANRDDFTDAVAVVVAIKINVAGSLLEQRHQPLDHFQTADLMLQISAPRYRPWRGHLRELLPSDWLTRPSDETPVRVTLDRDK